MSTVLIKYKFILPYTINMVEGEVTKDIEISSEETIKIILHPPTTSEKKRLIGYRSPKLTIWAANQINLDIEMKVEAPYNFKGIDEKVKPIAEKVLHSFLRYCRFETGQYQIDLKKSHIPSQTVFIDHDEKHEEFNLGGSMTTITKEGKPNLDNKTWQSVCNDMSEQTKIPFWSEALLDSKAYRMSADYKMAVLSAAMGIENVIHIYLREMLLSLGNISQTQIEKFLADVSNRLLVTVGFGIFSSVEPRVLESCRKTLDLRNAILHNQQRIVELKKATESIDNLEALTMADGVRDLIVH